MFQKCFLKKLPSQIFVSNMQGNITIYIKAFLSVAYTSFIESKIKVKILKGWLIQTF